MASAGEELQKDLEEVKALEKVTRKRVYDALTAEKSKTETEIKKIIAEITRGSKTS